jgi:oligopeptidase B
LLDRGFVYAIGHVRGGAFLGTEWYEDGKMLNKKNTFYDFIACAEHMIENKYTSKKLITIEGRSAGGLLVGASMILRPDLFNTVIAGVPFVDVLNTMSDPTIPLTTPEWEEWGNPNIQEYYEYMKQYSPYDNIKEGVSYPNILALGGLNDPRVQYWEPAKFIAKLREHNPNSGIKLLKTEMDQGHFGNTDRYKYMHEKAFDYAFVFLTYGINN